jgi:hypothetical protein
MFQKSQNLLFFLPKVLNDSSKVLLSLLKVTVYIKYVQKFRLKHFLLLSLSDLVVFHLKPEILSLVSQ